MPQAPEQFSSERSAPERPASEGLHSPPGFLAVAETMRQVAEGIETVIVGKRPAIDLALTAFLAGGHLLIEDIPGVGKTTLAKALARALGLVFKRVQFTPDLLPADITGTTIFNQKTAQFEFREGPVFANIVLADEINRATPTIGHTTSPRADDACAAAPRIVRRRAARIGGPGPRPRPAHRRRNDARDRRGY